jgi:hypothetical protein
VKRGAILLLAIAALGAPACGGKKDEPKPAPGSASGAAPAPGSDTPGSAAAGSAAAGSAAAGSAAAGSAAAAEVDVPTEVDFEKDAATKITEKNVEAQLKAVEQELSR